MLAFEMGTNAAACVSACGDHCRYSDGPKHPRCVKHADQQQDQERTRRRVRCQRDVPLSVHEQLDVCCLRSEPA